MHVLNTLELFDCLFWESSQKTITVINPERYKVEFLQVWFSQKVSKFVCVCVCVVCVRVLKISQ